MFDNLQIENLDLTYLATAFAFNVTLPAVDSAFERLTGFVLERFNRLANAMKSALGSTTKESVELSFKIDELQSEVKCVLKALAIAAKVVMGLAAILAIVCMLIPYTARITGVLMLPLPMYVIVALAYCKVIMWFSVPKTINAIMAQRESDLSERLVFKSSGDNR